MFDVGFWEILLILILALVIIGPERLPAAARQAGFFVGKARRYIEGVRSEVESEIDIGEFKRMLHNQEVQINELQQQLKSGVDDIASDIPSSDFLTDVPSHSFHDEKKPEDGIETSSPESITKTSADTVSDTDSDAATEPKDKEKDKEKSSAESKSALLPDENHEP